MTRRTLVRIYILEDGKPDYRHDQYDAAQFGDHLPFVGDIIVNPGVTTGLDRKLPENRELWEVVQRYFEPDTSNTEDGTAYVVYVVRLRRGRADEIDLLGE